MNKIGMLLFAVAVVPLCMGAGQISAQMPAAIDSPGRTVVATVHAEGAQVYECKADTEGKLTW
jgi:membrane protein required for beta-lactamase induction